LRELLTAEGYSKHAHHVLKLSPTAQSFFKNEYLSRSFTETREQISRRIYTIVDNDPLERMFANSTSRIDMRALLDEGSIILVNTAKSFLKEGSVFFTRFITALVFQAIQERNPLKDNLEVYMYIDEAAPIISPQTEEIISTARKYKFGLILAFQNLNQIPADLQNSILSNTSIKALSGISSKDARALAGDVGMKPDALMSIPKFTFLHHLRGHGTEYITVEAGALARLKPRTDLKQLIAENRERFCRRHVHVHKPVQDDSQSDI
jgi:hypothetical protein